MIRTEDGYRVPFGALVRVLRSRLRLASGSGPWPPRSEQGQPAMTAHADGSPDVPERLVYSVDEAADLLGIGRTYMFRLVATGEIDSFKIGSRRKIPRDALDRYIARLRAEQSVNETWSAQPRPSNSPADRGHRQTPH